MHEFHGDLLIGGMRLEHLRCEPTEVLASFVERSQQFVERNRRVAGCIRRRLVTPRNDEPQDDDALLMSDEFAGIIGTITGRKLFVDPAFHVHIAVHLLDSY